MKKILLFTVIAVFATIMLFGYSSTTFLDIKSGWCVNKVFLWPVGCVWTDSWPTSLARSAKSQLSADADLRLVVSSSLFGRSGARSMLKAVAMLEWLGEDVAGRGSDVDLSESLQQILVSVRDNRYESFEIDERGFVVFDKAGAIVCRVLYGGS